MVQRKLRVASLKTNWKICDKLGKSSKCGGAGLKKTDQHSHCTSEIFKNQWGLDASKNKLGQRKSQTPFSSAFHVQKNVCPKRFGSKKIKAQKIFWSEKILIEKISGPKLFLVQLDMS